MSNPTTTQPSNEKMLTLSSGLWALIVGVLIGLGIVAWRVSTVVFNPSSKLRGDGLQLETYGYDLAKTTVPEDELIPAQMSKDYMRALVRPESVPGSRVPWINKAQRGKFLVSSDQVIGVHVNGEARAYPLRFMIWHEIANDSLGGKNIAVTYNMLTDSVMAFDRKVGEHTLEFGVSGVVYRSNLLMYDRQPNQEGESLWSQMGAAAVAGPRAGTPLTVIPTRLLPWGAWLKQYPKSSVMKPPPELVIKKLYKVSPKPLYRNHDRLLFPVSPLPPEGTGVHKKDRIIAVRVDGKTVVYPLVWILDKVGDRGELSLEQNGVKLTFFYDRDSHTADVRYDAGDRSIEVYAALWFAWFAFHPTDPLWDRAAS